MKPTLLFILFGCPLLQAAESQAPTEASIVNPVKEADLTTVTLTPAASKRLGITVVPVVMKVTPLSRLYGGEVVLPMITGSGTGLLMSLAQPQSTVELLKLAELQVAADGELSQASVRLDAAERGMERANKLLENRTGSERTAEEARSARDLARAAYEQSKAKRGLLGAGIASSADGTIWWIRVPVPSADTGRLDGSSPAVVNALGSSIPIAAKRVPDAPATASSGTLTSDWFFEISDPQKRRRAGERVEVRVSLSGTGAEKPTVPWTAVLHDIHGGQWVYEETGADTFVRRRVQVEVVAGEDAVLASGPATGAKVVTAGSAELFGIEFGPGK